MAPPRSKQPSTLGVLVLGLVIPVAACASQLDGPAQPPECSAGSSLTPELLLEHAIPDTVHHPVPVPDDENAALPWLEAARRFQGISGEDYEQVLALTHGRVHADAPFPDGEEGRALAAWLSQHQLVFELLDRAASMDRLQLPPLSLEDDDVPPLLAWRYMAVMKALRAKQRGAQGNWDGALRDLSDILGLGTKLAEGDAELIRFLMAAMIQGLGLEGVQGVARDPAAPDDAVERLLAAVQPPGDLCEVWARALRVEFTQFYIPTLAEYPIDATLDVRWKWLREHEPWSGDDNDEAIVSLLRDHPCAFDPGDTAHLVSQQIRRGVEACDLPWSRARDHAAQHPALSDAEKVLHALITSEDSLPSAEALKGARRALLATQNPLGRQSIDGTYVSGVEQVFQTLACWRATRVILLIESDRRRHGRPPASLSDLGLEDDDLTTTDPFSGEDFRYDAARGLLWSVGANGLDDGGQPDAKDSQSDDLFWGVTPRHPEGEAGRSTR